MFDNHDIMVHADEIRNKIMPINKVYPIETVMDALKIYLKKTNRRLPKKNSKIS